MHWTARSLAACLAAGAAAVALFPHAGEFPATRAHAQDSPRPAAVKVPATKPVDTATPATPPVAERPPGGPPDAEPAGRNDRSEMVARKLAQRMDAEFNSAPLEVALETLARRYDVDVYVRRDALEDAGVAVDVEVPRLHLRQVRGDTVLDLLLEPHGLAYAIRDGILVVTTHDDLESSLELRVYNCADLRELTLPPDGAPTPLLPGPPGLPSGTPGAGGGGIPASGLPPGGAPASPTMGAVPFLFGSAAAGKLPPPTPPLIRVITATVYPDSWVEAGGSGSIELCGDGLLVISTTPPVHRKVEQLLEMLRQAAEQGPGSIQRE